MTVDAMEVAQRAEVTASTAMARIGSHEVNCERRYQENNAIQREIRDEVRALAAKLQETSQTLTAKVEDAARAPLTKAHERSWTLRFLIIQVVGTGAMLAGLKLLHLG